MAKDRPLVEEGNFGCIEVDTCLSLGGSARYQAVQGGTGRYSAVLGSPPGRCGALLINNFSEAEVVVRLVQIL